MTNYGRGRDRSKLHLHAAGRGPYASACGAEDARVVSLKNAQAIDCLKCKRIAEKAAEKAR